MFYGFLTINTSVSNTPGAINSIGELSEIGYTYAKSIQNYAESASRLSVFFNEYTDTYIVDNQESLCAQAAALLNGFSNYADSGTLLAKAVAALGTAVDVSVGLGILNNKDSKVYPEWVQFTLPLVDHTVTFKVWLANGSWLEQYPKGEFQFVLPTNDLQSLYNDFEGNRSVVAGAVLNPITMLTKAQNETVQPVTKYDNITLRVYKRTDHSKHFDMPIIIPVNGGSIFNNNKNYIAAFIDLLVDTGPHTLEEWLLVIPGLVALDKFYVIPTWGNKAVALPSPNNPPVVGSPSIIPGSLLDFKQEYFPEMAPDTVFGHLVYTTMAYKSYGLYILADIDNGNGRLNWKVTFPDYFVRSVSDLSAGLMSTATLEMSILLDALIRVAETWEPGDDLPVDVTVEIAYNYTYLLKSVGNTTLAILTYKSWLDHQEP